MKKLTSLLVVVALALGMMAFAGCWFEAQSISFVEAPATTFTLGENVLDFTIRVNEDGTTKDYRYSDYKGLISVSGFNTDTVGSRRATVTYDGKFSLRFDYTVVNDKFAGGTGSEFDPYLVSTPGQFQNLLDSKTFNYYKLTKSIDFYNYPLRMANWGDKATSSAEAWSGYIDGAGYSIYNLCTVLNPDWESINKYNELFGIAGSKENGPFVMKNLTVNFASEGTSPVPGLILTAGSEGVIEYDNVKITGYVNVKDTIGSNVAPFISFINRKGNMLAGKITLNGCESSIHYRNAYSAYNVSGFVGTQTTLADGLVEFNNCTFSGIIEGSNGSHAGTAAFAVSGGSANNPKAFTFDGCKISENAQLIKTSDKASGIYTFTNSAEMNVEGVTNNATALVKEISKFTLDVTDGVVTASVEGAHHYDVYSIGSMSYENGSGGAFRCLQFTVESNNLNKALYKVQYATGNAPANNSTGLLVYGNSVITYYGETVCKSIDVSSCTIMVIAYNSDNAAIAFGSKGGINLTPAA